MFDINELYLRIKSKWNELRQREDIPADVLLWFVSILETMEGKDNAGIVNPQRIN